MENLTIEATKQTPAIEFNINGYLKMEGRAYPENAAAFFDPLIEFVQELTVQNVIMDINLEYINTASSKKLLHLMQELDDMDQLHNIVVNWHYEEGDEDSIETAEIYEEYMERVRFTYNETADIYL